MTVAHCLTNLRQSVKRRGWRDVEMMTGPPRWTFLSDHVFILICIVPGPEIRSCDPAKRLLIIRRAVRRNIGGLEEAVNPSRSACRVTRARRCPHGIDVSPPGRCRLFGRGGPQPNPRPKAPLVWSRKRRRRTHGVGGGTAPPWDRSRAAAQYGSIDPCSSRSIPRSSWTPTTACSGVSLRGSSVSSLSRYRLSAILPKM